MKKNNMMTPRPVKKKEGEWLWLRHQRGHIWCRDSDSKVW